MTDDKFRLLKCKDSDVDPVSCWPFVKGIRERAAGNPRKKGRWLTPMQQRYWEEGWNLMDELLFYKEGEDDLP